MRELSALKALTELTSVSEAKAGSSDAVSEFFNRLQDDVDTAYTAIDKLRKTAQSSVLTDMIKDAKLPATLSKSAKFDIEEAFQAIRKVEEEINNLFQEVSSAHSDFDTYNG